jgi:glycine oxidase
MNRNNPMKVAVVGAGVGGLSAAWRLGQAGCSVTLFDLDSIPSRAGAATWASAGMICARLEMKDAPGAVRAFALNARAAWRAFAGELDRSSAMSCGLVERGALHVLFEGEGFPEPAEDIDLIDAAMASRLEPGLAANIRGAAWAPGEAHVDPRWLALALVRACRSVGVAFAADTRVLRLTASGGAVTGVATAEGRLAFDHVVLAAGAWTSRVLRVSNLPGPRVRPVKGQMVSLAGGSAPMVTRTVWTARVYIVPHADGRILVGATQEEAGFDTALDGRAIDELKAEAVRAFPELARLPELERFCGFRPATDDGLPVLGGIGVDSLTLLSGQFRNGILFAPLVANAAAQHVLQNSLPGIAQPFAAGRFADAWT